MPYIEFSKELRTIIDHLYFLKAETSSLQHFKYNIYIVFLKITFLYHPNPIPQATKKRANNELQSNQTQANYNILCTPIYSSTSIASPQFWYNH
jgi:hypothetical protein